MSLRTVLVLVALLLLARVLLLAAGADVHGYGEEFAKGAAARLLLSDLRATDGGTGIPVCNVPYVLHEGGGTMVTYAKLAAFALVGPSVLANKLVALATSALVLVALLAAAKELFGVRAATIAGFAFVLAPESFLRFSLLSLGTHFEASFFALACLAVASRLAEGRERRAVAWFVLGVVASLGAYASLIALPAIAAGFGRVAVERGRELARRAGFVAVGLLAGAAPWLWTVRHAGLDAVRIRGEGLSGGDADPLRALSILFERVFDGDPGRVLLVVAMVGLPVLAFLVPRRAVEPAMGRGAFTVVGWIVLFLAAYASSGFALHPDAAWFFFLRTTPLWIAGVLLFAAAVARLEERGGGARAIARAAFAIVVGIGLVDAGRLAAEGRPSKPIENVRLLAVTQGYDWSEYFDKLLRRLPGTEEEKLARLARLDDEPARLDPDLARSAFEHANRSLPDVLEALHQSLGTRADGAIPGLCFFLHPGFGHDPDAAFRALEAAPERDRAALAEAIGRAGLGPRFRADRIAKQLERDVDPAWRERWIEGAGWRLYRAFPLRPDRALAFVAEQPERLRPALERGWSRAASHARVR